MKYTRQGAYNSIVMPLLLSAVSFTGSPLHAELQEISDEDLSEIAGQSVIQLTQIAPCAGGATGCTTAEMLARGYTTTPTGYNSGDLGFSRIEIGATIEINANIEELVLGEYPRAGYTESADVSIEDMSLGTIDPSTGARTDVVMQDPFIEFAFRENGSGQPTEIVGLRLGFKSMDGTLGVQINSVSGDIEASALGVPIHLFGLTLGTANIKAEGHAPRLTALSVDQSGVTGDSGLIGFIFNTGAGAALGAALVGDQQLAPYHQIVNDNSQNFYVSAANQEIYYPKIGDGAQGPAQEGFWLNLQDQVFLPGVETPNAASLDFQGTNEFPVNCFNGNVRGC